MLEWFPSYLPYSSVTLSPYKSFFFLNISTSELEGFEQLFAHPNMQYV